MPKRITISVYFHRELAPSLSLAENERAHANDGGLIGAEIVFTKLIYMPDKNGGNF